MMAAKPSSEQDGEWASQAGGHALASAVEVRLANALLNVLRHDAGTWTEIVVKSSYGGREYFRVIRDTDGLQVIWPTEVSG